MKNKNIVLASLVVIILGGLIAYQYVREPKENVAGNNKENVAQEKVIKNNQEIVADANNVEPVVGEAEDISNSIIYFYGAECPHCKDVLAYLNEKDIYGKVDFIKKEVWHNKKNGEELRTAALKCGMDPSNIGVPFLFSEGKCYMGGPDVIDFFAKKAGLKK